jgi:hypothetical protein
MRRSLAVAAMALAGCASAPPLSPGVLVLPGSSKSYDAFRVDEAACRKVADSDSGSDPALQRRYDFTYQQCMYAKGHKVPSAGEAPRQVTRRPPPPPPPPPG